MDMTTSKQIAAAGQALAAARARRDSLTPEQAAAEAHVPGGPTVEELTERIRAQRESESESSS